MTKTGEREGPVAVLGEGLGCGQKDGALGVGGTGGVVAAVIGCREVVGMGPICSPAKEGACLTQQRHLLSPHLSQGLSQVDS